MTRGARHVWFLWALVALVAVDCLLILGGERAAASRLRIDEGNRAVVRALGLTDLSLWTEARFTRHPSQTDFFSPFQDLPGGMEHFPAGALLAPPRHLVTRQR